MHVPRLIVGLGNPGREYERTRHNAGFWWVDAIASARGGRWARESKFSGHVARVEEGGRDFWLLKPGTYMNESGRSVGAFLRFHRIAPAEMLVVHDRGPAQRRQVHPVQRAHQTAAAQAANYPFCTIEPNVGDVAVPEPAARRAREDRRARRRSSRPHQLRRHRRPRARRVQGRGPGQPVSRQHPRLRRRGLRGAASSTTTSSTSRAGSTPSRPRDHRDRADARRPGEPREAPQGTLEKRARRRQGGRATLRLVKLALDPCSTPGKPARAADHRGGGREGLADAPAPHLEARRSTCATSTRPPPTRATRSRPRWPSAPPATAPRGGDLRPHRERDRRSPPDERKEFLDTLGLNRAGAQPAHPRGLRPARAATYFTVGPEGGARLDHPQGRHRAAVAAGVIHTDFERASSAPRPSPTTTSSPEGRAGARDAGRLRLEGKEYVVQDGDVMHFRRARAAAMAAKALRFMTGFP
jgi:hypothetical protein